MHKSWRRESVHPVLLLAWYWAFAHCSLSGGVDAAWADEVAAPKGYTLEDVIVSEERIEERLSAELEQYGHQVTIVPGEKIEKGGYADLYQALESLVPGLFVSVKNGRGDYAR